jgi:hypothetical protein
MRPPINTLASPGGSEPQRVVCTRCGTGFDCDPGGDCWCRHVEVRLPMPKAGATCLCAACLRAAAAVNPTI